MSTVWLNGKLVPRSAASIPVDDLGFLYGAACFETMRAAGGAIFRLGRHIRRLEAGLDAMGVHAPGRATLTGAVRETLEANGLVGGSTEARVRLTVSAGPGNGRPDLAAASAPTVLITAEPLPAPPGPARLAVVTQRLDEQRPLREAKTANYLTLLLALREARAAGCDDALLINHRGHVAEAATANLFAVAVGTLVTPPLDDGPLPGITREAVLECAAAIELPAVERSQTLEQLLEASELFITNSVVGVRPVRAVDGRWSARACPGPVTSALDAAYRRLVRTEGEV